MQDSQATLIHGVETCALTYRLRVSAFAATAKFCFAQLANERRKRTAFVDLVEGG